MHPDKPGGSITAFQERSVGPVVRPEIVDRLHSIEVHNIVDRLHTFATWSMCSDRPCMWKVVQELQNAYEAVLKAVSG